MLFAGNVLNSRFKMFRIELKGEFKDKHIFPIIESLESLLRVAPLPTVAFKFRTIERGIHPSHKPTMNNLQYYDFSRANNDWELL